MAATNLLGTLPDPNYWRLPMLQRRVRRPCPARYTVQPFAHPAG